MKSNQIKLSRENITKAGARLKKSVAINAARESPTHHKDNGLPEEKQGPPAAIDGGGRVDALERGQPRRLAKDVRDNDGVDSQLEGEHDLGVLKERVLGPGGGARKSKLGKRAVGRGLEEGKGAASCL